MGWRVIVSLTLLNILSMVFYLYSLKNAKNHCIIIENNDDISNGIKKWDHRTNTSMNSNLNSGYVFIVKSNSNSKQLRYFITKSWHNFNVQYQHINNHTMETKLIFSIMYSTGTEVITVETAQNNLTFVSRRMTLKELLRKNNRTKYFIFTKETTFINFQNIVTLLQKQGINGFEKSIWSNYF